MKLKSSQADELGAVVRFATEYLEELGLRPTLHGEKGRPAIFASSGKRGVVMSGHLDTVPEGQGWSRGQGEAADDRLYGRGACDMKGGCTGVLLAAKNLSERGVPFSICLTLDEETTMNGAKAVADAGLLRNAPAVLVAEPTDFNIVVKEKGLVQFSVETKGKNAHASMPALGDNAIVKMVSLLQRIDDLQKIPEDPLEELTMCVDTIKGGTQMNVIPDGCRVEVDSRYPPGMTTEDVLAMVRKRLEGADYTLEVIHQLDPVITDPECDAVRALQAVVGDQGDIMSVPYATEMVMFKQDNDTLMVCGPGDPRMAHVIDEWVSVDDVARAADIYEKYCTEMAAKES